MPLFLRENPPSSDQIQPIKSQRSQASAVSMAVLLGVTSLLACNEQSPSSEPEPFFEKCSENICLVCDTCVQKDVPVLNESFRLQNKAYLCIADAVNYDPAWELEKPAVNYTFSYEDRAFVGLNMGKVVGTEVISPGFIGLVYNTDRVANVDDVRMDLHETTHVFTNRGLGGAPNWFHEGFSIFIEETLDCDEPKQYGYADDGDFTLPLMRLDSGSEDWKRVQNGLPPTFGNPLDAPHIKGAIFFSALKDDFHWNDEKIILLWGKLRYAHEHGQKITSEVIKETVQNMTDGDLSELFRLLNI